jgi:hypothetical protein
VQAVENGHTLSNQAPSEADQKAHLIEHILGRLIGLQVSIALSQEASNQASVSPVSLGTAKERPGITLHRQWVEDVHPKARAMKGKGQGATINPRSLQAHHSPRRKLTKQVRNALGIRKLTDLGTNGHVQTASAHIHADKDHGKRIKGQAPLCTLTSDPKGQLPCRRGKGQSWKRPRGPAYRTAFTCPTPILPPLAIKTTPRVIGAFS